MRLLSKTLSSNHQLALALILLLTLCAVSPQQNVRGQDEIDASEIQAIMQDDGDAPPADAQVEPTGIDLMSLIASGGMFMIPIGVMSLLVVMLAIERMFTLRRSRILPRDLVDELDDLSEPIQQFNPTVAYQACLDNPSPLASVVGAMLLRTGQPLGDIERAATDTVQREVDRYSSPIRWLNLAAAATPLMGLMGTVWGMIVAFHESTTLSAERSRSEQLSEGIYTALVTTLAGLIVAIPAAILAQYLENRVIKLFHRMEQIAFDIAPGLTRFEGRRFLDNDGVLRHMDAAPARTSKTTATPPPAPPPLPPKPVKGKKAAKDGAKTR